MKDDLLEKLIDIAIAEDIGDGDHSSLSCIEYDKIGSVKLLIKQHGVLAGIEIVKILIKKIDKNLKLDIKIKDGSLIKSGDEVLFLTGSVLSILKIERLLLNFMQRMSGIATETAKYANLISDLKTKVLDTRKTTPGLRYFEKMAVEIGGGKNHRFGLFDMIMLKDNHVDFAGGIENAIEKANDYLIRNKKDLKIEIEIRNLKELDFVIKTGKIHRIMLDNFDIETTKKAVEIISGRYEIESSGGITFETIRSYAECGVDFVSVGALTHQIKSLDMSLKAI